MEKIIKVKSIRYKEKLELKESELIDLYDVFSILNRHSFYERRTKREMKKILFDEENEFPEIFYSPNKKEYGDYPSYRSNKIFFIREDFVSWCEERNIYIEE